MTILAPSFSKKKSAHESYALAHTWHIQDNKTAGLGRMRLGDMLMIRDAKP